MKTLKPTIFIIFNLVFMICQAQIIHVPLDQPTIQAGIDAAHNWGDTVLVAEGTYYENIDFSGKFITVASEFAMDGDTNHINNTIIDGSQPANPDYGSVVFFHSGEDTNSVICGFTITGGTGIYVPALDLYGGGGIGIENNSGAKIIHNHIEYNTILSTGSGSGGGIGAGDANNTNYVVIKHNRICNNAVIANENSEGGGIAIFCNAIIKDNTVCNNTVTTENETAAAGGIRVIGYNTERYIECSGNLISNNEVYSSSNSIYAGAGGLQVFRCNGVVSNNMIINNSVNGNFGSIGGGILSAYSTYTLQIENNFLSNNKANFEEPGGKGGGIYIVASNPLLVNNIFTHNYASQGSGLYHHLIYDLPAQVINNTIAYNNGDEGGGIFLEDADMVVMNTILWDNENYVGNEIAMMGISNIDIAYSDVSGGWPGGIYILDEDPEFEDDSCHLNCLDPSPCIDAGIKNFDFNSVTCNAPDYDFEGNVRPLDVTYDIGADESKILTGITEVPSTNESHMSVFPNPSSGAANIQYSTYSIQYTKVELYSADGVKVKTLFTGKQPAGEHTMNVDLSDLPDGIYFIRMQAGQDAETAKLVLIK